MEAEPLCPRCDARLVYCKGDLGQDFLFCPTCTDAPYDPELGAALSIGEFS